MDPITITEINQHIDNAVTNINSNINNVNSYAYNANIYAKNANANAALIPDISNTVINANTYAKNANTHAYNANLTIDTVKTLINNLSNDVSNINNFVTALNADVGNLSTNVNIIKTNAALLPNISNNSNLISNINTNLSTANTYAYNANLNAYNANIYAKNANTTISTVSGLVSNISNDLANLTANINNANIHAYNANLNIVSVTSDLSNIAGQLNDVVNQLTTFSTNINLIPNINTNLTTVNTHAYNANTYAKNANTYAYNSNLNAYNANTYAKNANTNAALIPNIYNSINAQDTLLGTMNTNVTSANTYAKNANTYAYNANIHAYNAEQNAVNILTNTNLIPSLNTNISCSNYWAYMSYMRANAMYNGDVAINTNGRSHYQWFTIYKSFNNNSVSLTTSNNTESAYVKKIGTITFSTSYQKSDGYTHIIFGASNVDSNVSLTNTNVDYTFIISKDNLTTTPLATYNSLISSANTIFVDNFFFAGSINSTKNNNNISGILYSNIFELNTAYYFYFAIHRKSSSHNAEKLNWYTPRMEIQMYFYDNSLTQNQSGIKYAGMTKYCKTNSNTSMPVSHCQIVDITGSILEPHCEFNHVHPFGEGGSSILSYVIVNSNIWTIINSRTFTQPNEIVYNAYAYIQSPIFVKEYY